MFIIKLIEEALRLCLTKAFIPVPSDFYIYRGYWPDPEFHK